jgi:hypothetical protein
MGGCRHCAEYAREFHAVRLEAAQKGPSDLVSKQLVLDWLGGYAGPQEPEFFAKFLDELEWRIANEGRMDARRRSPRSRTFGGSAPGGKVSDEAKCSLCGEPMPKGEEMFYYHGYSGPCPKPPLEPRPTGPSDLERAQSFVRKLLIDAQGPNTGSLEGDAEAWPGCGIDGEELVKRLAAEFRAVRLEAARKARERCAQYFCWPEIQQGIRAIPDEELLK